MSASVSEAAAVPGAPEHTLVTIEEAVRCYRGRGYTVALTEAGVYLLTKGLTQQVWTEDTLREAASRLVRGQAVERPEQVTPRAPEQQQPAPIPAAGASGQPAPRRNLEAITAEIQVLKRQTAASIIEIGRRLLEAQELVGAGHFEAYLRDQVQLSRTTAYRFMRAAREFDPVSPVAQVEPSKVYALLELPAAERDAFIQEHDLAGMSKRGTEAAIADWRRKAEEAERKAAEAEARARQAESRPLPPPQQVMVSDPQQQAELARLQRELDRATRQYTALLAKAEGQRQAETALKESRQKLAALAARMQRLGLQFDDGGRDQNGGLKLLEAIDPIHQVITRVLGDVQVLKRAGVGGWCEEQRVADLSRRLRDLAGLLDEILKDRRARPINVNPVEVE